MTLCAECNDELDEDTKPGETVCNLCRDVASEYDPPVQDHHAEYERVELEAMRERER